MKKRSCLITGVSGGLGGYLVAGLAEHGWRVIGTGRRPVAEAEIPSGIEYIQADLSDSGQIDGIARQVGHCPDLVIHSAVQYPAAHLRGNAVAVNIAEMEKMMRINTLAPYKITMDLLAQKAVDQFAGFIFINSDSMFHADANAGLYASSKAALRILTTSVADACRGQNASASTLLLGPLADERKLSGLRAIAGRQGMREEDVVKAFLKKSNPELVIDQLIDYESCLKSIYYLSELGPIGNGMVCRLDGGSAGSLI